jgi:hypothetical protein
VCLHFSKKNILTLIRLGHMSRELSLIGRTLHYICRSWNSNSDYSIYSVGIRIPVILFIHLKGGFFITKLFDPKKKFWSHMNDKGARNE